MRLRQQLDLRRHTQELQVALLNRYVANVVEEIRVEIPLDRVTHVIAIGGDVRFVAAQLSDGDTDGQVPEIGRQRFLDFCSEIERLDDDSIVDRFRLPADQLETLLPALLIYRRLVSETATRSVIVSSASLRAGVLIDVAEPKSRLSAEDFAHQVLASADTLGHRYRFDREHGHHVAMLAVAALRPAARRARPRRARTAAPAGGGAAARRRHVRQPARASQAFAVHPLGLADLRPLRRGDGDRLEHRALSSPRVCRRISHLPFIALDRTDRLIVNKLAAILRLVNALDAEHAQKVRDARLVRGATTWTLELDGEAI